MACHVVQWSETMWSQDHTTRRSSAVNVVCCNIDWTCGPVIICCRFAGQAHPRAYSTLRPHWLTVAAGLERIGWRTGGLTAALQLLTTAS